MRHPRGITVAVGACLATAARADIAYDALTGHPSNQWLYNGNTEMAEDTVLAPGAGLLITAITIRAREPTSNNTYIGSIRVSVFADAFGVPGALLTTRTLPLTLLPTQVVDVVVDVPDALAPSPLIWTSWFFEFPGTSIGLPSTTFGGTPTVGLTSEFIAVRPGGAGPWTLEESYNGFGVRVESIPAPASAAVCALAAAVGAVRRRRARVSPAGVC